MHTRVIDSMHCSTTFAAAWMLVFAALALLALPADVARAASCTQAAEVHADPTSGRSWNRVWYCGNDAGAALYLDADHRTTVGYMDSQNSWFVCYARGVRHTGGNDVWYYTQGDRATASWSARRGWGFMPASRVWTSPDPYPGIPPCGFAEHSSGVGAAPSPLLYFPVRGRHKTGAFDDAPSRNPALWSCNAANSRSDFSSPAHLGVDILAAEGTAVVAPVAGVIRQAEWSAYSGNQVTVVDLRGWSHYMTHLRSIAVAVGVRVRAGAIVGRLGHTGTAANGVNHLHYSIYPGPPARVDRYGEGIDPHPHLLRVERNTCAVPPLGLRPLVRP